jgi:ABC-type antimicrobial peptide transport system permease subunit
MFTLSRIIMLVLASILITTVLYCLDSDPGTDNLMQRATVTALIFFVVTLLYAGFYGLFKSLRRKRA